MSHKIFALYQNLNESHENLPVSNSIAKIKMDNCILLVAKNYAIKLLWGSLAIEFLGALWLWLK
jgi:hypothetical protein